MEMCPISKLPLGLSSEAIEMAGLVQSSFAKIQCFDVVPGRRSLSPAFYIYHVDATFFRAARSL
jgi:hypothetical protein